MYWWKSIDRERRINNVPQVQYWNDLKSALRRMKIPSYYHREVMDKLQRLHQNNKRVEQYRQKIELLFDLPLVVLKTNKTKFIPNVV